MKKPSALTRLTQPPVTQEFYDRLMQAFQPIEVKPDTPLNAIMYSAGQQELLAWIRRHVGSSTNQTE
jgi:hypothetical protein